MIDCRALLFSLSLYLLCFLKIHYIYILSLSLCIDGRVRTLRPRRDFYRLLVRASERACVCVCVRPKVVYDWDGGSARSSNSFHVVYCRGKCVIRHYKDISALRDFEPLLDTFFYILGYNPENNRLASIQGEIRVGSAHQVCYNYYSTYMINFA